MAEGIKLGHLLAKAGICSRRKAEEHIKAGDVIVNGKTVCNVAHRTSEGDQVLFKRRPVVLKRVVHILLNKPTKVVSTASDEQERKTVVDLVRLSPPARLFPVGRLDSYTTGAIILTNDGAFAQRLAHPRFKVEKRYHITLTTPLDEGHAARLRAGVRLSDGFFKPDSLDAIENRPTEWIMSMHSGRNRVIRRFFKELGYTIKRLDRISYAGLSTSGLARGAWRFLDEKEVARLSRLGGGSAPSA
ncbi:MAG: rRNA pseudouridine synthase [Candidatus Dependentiae bacterium]|nr:rRNA pseudouridine synthase [Candidatus Dependentiae bacterium]